MMLLPINLFLSNTIQQSMLLRKWCHIYTVGEFHTCAGVMYTHDLDVLLPKKMIQPITFEFLVLFYSNMHQSLP